MEVYMSKLILKNKNLLNQVFSVKDHRPSLNGHSTCSWCSQDENKKKKSQSGLNPNVQTREKIPMEQFQCQSCLWVSCHDIDSKRIISFDLTHCLRHKPYFDVAMPPEADELIRESLEWSTPISIASKVQATFPSVMNKQVHAAWTEMSQMLWK